MKSGMFRIYLFLKDETGDDYIGKIKGSIISMVDLPTTEIIEPFIIGHMGLFVYTQKGSRVDRTLEPFSIYLVIGRLLTMNLAEQSFNLR